MTRPDLESLWWMLWIGALGGCVGSFLNMLIYRLPRGIGVLRPRGSICPNCGARIRWFDNIPLLSYLRLCGRCRGCRAPISARYPLIEAVTALSFMLLFDAFCVEAVRGDLATSRAFGPTEHAVAIWPMLVAHLVLLAGLIVVSVIDVEEYWVDVRITWSVAAVGLISYAIGQRGGSVPDAGAAVPAGVVYGASGGLILSWLVVSVWRVIRPERRESPDETWRGAEAARDALAHAGQAGAARHEVAESLDARVVLDVGPLPDVAGTGAEVGGTAPGGRETAQEASPPDDFAHPPASAGADDSAPVGPDGSIGVAGESVTSAMPDITVPAPEEPRGSLGGLLVAAAALLAIVGYALLVSVPAWEALPVGRFAARAGIVFGLIYLALIAASARRRVADAAIAHAIERERYSARQMIFGELAYLLPAVAGAVALGLWATRAPEVAAGIERVLAYEIFGRAPAAGLTNALRGLLIAGGIGWSIRIAFTLVLGKEALGFGDVHILAAAGAVTGWVVVGLGFFAAALLAVVGVVLLLAFKRSRAIPFGPWLALGILAMTIMLDRALEFLRPAVRAWRELLAG